jgi:hypothetical protein
MVYKKIENKVSFEKRNGVARFYTCNPYPYGLFFLKKYPSRAFLDTHYLGYE